MNYGQIRDYALQLIRQYTIAGTPYAASYNNQQDYLNMIPNLLNDALVTIATNFRRRDAFIELDPADAEEYGGYKRFTLPEDLLDIKTNGLLVPSHEPDNLAPEYITDYKLMPPDFILLPKRVRRVSVLSYYRRPQIVPDNPADDAPVDATLAEQYCAAYYIAAHLVMLDDPFAYQALYNEFESKAARLAPALTVEMSFVHDDYGHMASVEGVSYV